MDQEEGSSATVVASVSQHVRLFSETVVPWQTFSGLAWLLAGVFCCNQPVRLFSDWTIIPLLVALVSIRFSGMCWNNLIDWQFDAIHPRNRWRALPSGRLRPQALALYALGTLFIFLVSCAFLPPIGQAMGIVLAVAVLLYSFTKRVTIGCHFVLGLIYACLPLAGAVWQSDAVSRSALFLSLAAFCSVSGTDILYAVQDMAFDRKVGLRSIPARFGVFCAKKTAAALHVAAIVGCTFGFLKAGVGLVGLGVWGVCLAVLFAAWRLLWIGDTDDLSKAFPFLLSFFPGAAFCVFLADRVWIILL